ncbi:hypothetical protein EDC04DRAFT_2652755, partial [Pisolithus marmoratus]
MAVVHALSRSLGIFSAVPSSLHLLLIVVVATSAANFTCPCTPVVQFYARRSVRPTIRSYIHKSQTHDHTHTYVVTTTPHLCDRVFLSFSSLAYLFHA